jgi:hypothetical protein
MRKGWLWEVWGQLSGNIKGFKAGQKGSSPGRQLDIQVRALEQAGPESIDGHGSHQTIREIS